MLIKNYYGRTGSGKSTEMKTDVMRQRGRHLFVVPRRQSVEESYNDLCALNSQFKINIHVKAFCSEDGRREKTNIRKQILDSVAALQKDEHSCFVLTHAAFLMIDPVLLAGFHLKLDEIPHSANLSGTFFSPVMYEGYRRLFTIEPLTKDDLAQGIDPTLMRLYAREGVEAKDLLADPKLAESDRNAYQRAASHYPVYTDAKTIDEIGQRQCSWGSPWSLDRTEEFASVEIAACDIEESLMHKLSPRPYKKVLCPTPPSAARIRIFFFDNGADTCSAAYWESEIGIHNLALVGQEIARRKGVDFWTCNKTGEKVLKPLIPKSSPRREDDLDPIDGTWVSQQQDGTNRFRKCTSCAILISSKAQDHEAIFERIHSAATKAAISKGREEGLIFQFVSRGAIRETDFAGDYTVYVFDRQQAEALRDKLVFYGYSDTLIEHVALPGFSDRVREPKGRKPTYSTPEERAIAKRQQSKARQQRYRSRKALEALKASTIEVLDDLSASFASAGQEGSRLQG